MRSSNRGLLSLTTLGVVVATATAAASAPAGRYVLGSNVGGLTVHDTKTGLTWEQMFVPATQLSDAQMRCARIELETGEAGWRVPTLKELLTLVDYTTDNGSNAMIDAAFFPNTPPWGFWSSTTSTVRPQRCVDFASGLDGCAQSMNYIRCVR
jgi:hypothetical protein